MKVLRGARKTFDIKKEKGIKTKLTKKELKMRFENILYRQKLVAEDRYERKTNKETKIADYKIQN